MQDVTANVNMATRQHLQSDAIVEYATTGAYPDDEDGILSAELPPDAITGARERLSQAKQEVENEIKATSRNVAPDVDGWIKRAKQLQADIEQSRNIAKSVVEEAEFARKAKASEIDAAKKAELLKVESALQDDLGKTLRKMLDAKNALRAAKETISGGSTYAAFEILQRLEKTLETLDVVGKTNAVDLLRHRIQDVRSSIVEQARGLMRDAINVDRSTHRLSVQGHVKSAAGQDVSITQVVDLSFSLGQLHDEISRLASDIEVAVVGPIFAHGTIASDTSFVEIADGILRLSGPSPQSSHNNIIQDIIKMVWFIREELPPPANDMLSKIIVPSIVAHLISDHLPAALPAGPEQYKETQGVVDQVKQFADALDRASCSGSEDLKDWIDNVSRIWLAKRRMLAIDVLRRLVSNDLSRRKTAEHVETQVVSSDDAIAQNEDDQADDWDQEWGEDANEKQTHARAEGKPGVGENDEGEEDWGAWDADEPTSQQAGSSSPLPADPTMERDESGGWDDWDEQQPSLSSSPKKPKKDPHINGNVSTSKSSTQEITLRETYTTTALPDELYSSMDALIHDAQTLQNPPYSSSPIASAALALYTIPGIALSAFRSLAPPAYELIQGGNMLLFNDSNCLSTQLAALQSELTEASDPGISRLRLDTSIPTLEAFARRNYSKAMEEQRTVLRDLIDNAQGFAECTIQPHKSACDDAVAMTIAHLRSVAELWSTILSKNAWLQALGSLFGTVISKIIIDIEELGDIGAEESVQLKKYVMQLSGLKELFVKEGRETVGLYVRDWFKFQYLAEVLESNLEDIKFLWREGGLKNEFEMQEITDLMEALFADGDRRRRAITEIRRG